MVPPYVRPEKESQRNEPVLQTDLSDLTHLDFVHKHSVAGVHMT